MNSNWQTSRLRVRLHGSEGKFFTGIRLARLAVLLAAILPIGLAAQAPLVLDDDFRFGDHGWIALFSDHPPGVEVAWDLEAGLRPLPAELGIEGTGFVLAGTNHSDDLAMMLKKQLGPADGVEPGRTYRVHFEFEFASDAPSGSLGIGGAAGESVFLKAGASATEPESSLPAGDDHMRPTVNVGNQALGGPAATPAGHIANGRSPEEPPQFVKLTRVHQHTFAVQASPEGALWLILMTDSGFEGRTTLYILRIRVTLTPIEVGGTARLVNLSTRARVTPDEGALIAGFAISGPGPRRYLVRGVGPSLGQFGVPDPLTDPVLELFDQSGALVAVNDAWTNAPEPDAIRTAAASIGAFPLDEGSRDAALLVELSAGRHTAVMRGSDNLSGSGLVEIYDLDGEAPGARLVNLSSRGFAGLGGTSMFPGLVVTGPNPERLLVRAVGPGLAAHGIENPSKDPVLALFRDEIMIAQNVRWDVINPVGEITAAAQAAGAFPLDPNSGDAVLLITLDPGVYPMQVEEIDPGQQSIALIEIYQVP